VGIRVVRRAHDANWVVRRAHDAIGEWGVIACEKVVDLADVGMPFG
jgi:hypothetical protein